MGAASFNDAFAGATIENYCTVVAVERRPSIFIGGEPQGWYYVSVYARVQEATYRFVGLSSADAGTRSGSVNVTDADGTSYNVPLAPEIFNVVSSGGQSFVRRSVKVSSKPMSPHLWELVVRVYEATI